MATELRLRRGTTDEHGNFIGAEAEATVDTDKNTIVVHDGQTQGGFPLSREDITDVAVDSVASLRTSSFPANLERLYLSGYYGVGTPGGGDLYADRADTTTADNGGTVFVDSDGVRWKRAITENTYYVEWFGILADDTTEEQDKIQKSVDATPTNGTLVFPSIPGTILVDVPIDQNAPANRQRAVYFDKPMKVVGGKTPTRIKDFCTAWSGTWGTDLTGLCAYQAESSDVHIDGLVVDANADNHYEVDGSGDKFWETGPGGKRPPFGVMAQAADQSPNLENVVIENCEIDRPLGGVGLRGALGSTFAHNYDDAGFIDGSLTENLIVNSEIRNNKVNRARGNDYLLFSGVRSSSIHDNESTDSQYHVTRIYGSCIDCHSYNNQALVNYARIESKYNQTDLGYWRTDNAASGEYEIRRTGFRIGSSSDASSAVSTTIDCTQYNNEIRYDYEGTTAWESIVSSSGSSIAAIQGVNCWNGCVIEDNRAFNPPYIGIFVDLDPAEEGFAGEGVRVANNTVKGASLLGGDIRGENVWFHDNYLIDCAEDGERCLLIRGDNQKVFKNHLDYSVGGGTFANEAITVTGSTTETFVSDNILSGYSGERVIDFSGATIHGTDFGGVSLTLLNGWVLASVGSDQNDPKAIIDCAGNVTIEGYVDGAGGSTNTFVTLPALYRPVQDIYSPAMQAVSGASAAGTIFPMHIMTGGGVSMPRSNADKAAFSAHWVADFRLDSV